MKKQVIFNRIICMILTACLCIPTVPATAFAQTDNTGGNTNTTSESHVPEDVVLNYRDVEVDVNNRFTGAGEYSPTKGSLPASYSSSENIGSGMTVSSQKDVVTTAKNQYPYGTCWAHGVISVAETSYHVNNGLSASTSGIDWNEYHLTYFFYHMPDDPLDLFGGDYVANTSGSSDLNAGGNNIFTLFAFANWIGVSNSTTFRDSTVLNGTYAGNTDMAYGGVAHMTNGYMLNKNDTEVVKSAIMEYGSVAISYYASTTNSEDALYWNDPYYYNYKETGSNHAVTIVGWNDNIPAESFVKTAPGDGAWLVKNSWGTDWGENGYFWMSYYDTSLQEDMFVYNFESGDIYDNNYQYDGGVAPFSSRPCNDALVGSNAFVSDSEEEIKAVGFYTNNVNCNYEIRVYTDLEATEAPQEGTLALTQSGTKTYCGYHTVELNESIAVDEGERYAIVITLSKTGETVYMVVDDNYLVNDWIKSYSFAKAGESYLGTSVDTLYDLNASNTADNMSGVNVRIKAFTDEVQAVDVEEVEDASDVADFTYRYDMSYDGYFITGYKGAGGKVVIPNYISGKRVRGIDPEAFSEDETITSIVVSEGIEYLTGMTFYHCFALKSIYIPSTYKGTANENNMDFWLGYCPNVEKIEVGKNNPYYKVVDNIMYDKTGEKVVLFPPADPRTTLTIPEGVTVIGDSSCRDNVNIKNVVFPSTLIEIAFGGCTGLTELNIPEGCEYIGQFILTNSGIKSIHIPKSVHTIGDGAFFMCNKLEKFTVAADNAGGYYAEDGVLYGPELTATGLLESYFGEKSLICYPAAKAGVSFTVPNDTVTISYAAFNGASNLFEVIIPSSVKGIDSQAFGDVYLDQIYIPSTVVAVGSELFAKSYNQHETTIYGQVGSVAANYLSTCNQYAENVKFKAVSSVSEMPKLDVNGWRLGADANWRVYKDAVVDTTFTGLLENEYFEENNYWYATKGEYDSAATLVVEYEGGYYYVFEGCVKTDMTGIVQIGDEYWLIEFGKVALNYTDIWFEGNYVYYVVNGKVDTTYTGFFEYYGEQYYVKKGFVDMNYEGIVTVDDKKWLVRSGRVDTIYCGLYEYKGKTYYISSGMVETGKTGVIEDNGKLYYVKKGVLQTSYTGFKTYQGDKYYIKAGVARTDLTKIVTVDSKKYYVKKGILQKVTKIVTIGSKKYYVEDGVFLGKTQIAKVGKTKYYVEKGYYTGKTEYAKVGSKTYYVYKGKLTGKTGFVKVGSKKRYVKDDVVYTGIATINKKQTYVKSGVVQTSSGIVKVNDKSYYLKKGIVQTGKSGFVKVGSKTYYMSKGVVQNKTALVTKPGTKTKYYVKSGVVQSTTGVVKIGSTSYYLKKGIFQSSASKIIVKSGSKYYYITKGKVDTKKTGTVTYKGKKYKVKKGIATLVK